MGVEFDYAILIKNKTRLELLIERFNTKAQAKFYIESLGGGFFEYEREHQIFYEALDEVQKKLSKIIKNKIIDKVHLPSFLFSKKHLIVVLGRDGLVANTAKYSKTCPIIAVNPDPERYDGLLLPFNKNNFIVGVTAVLENKHHSKLMRFAKATLNDGQELLAFNDLFIGVNSHISARYQIQFGHWIEEQSSSGIIISTAAGATGWLSAVFNMAYGVVGLFEKKLQPQQPTLAEDQLLFVVREPFKSLSTETNLVASVIKNGETLIIRSLMPTHGIIFSDGVETDFLKFNSGAIARIKIADETATMVTHL
jgi:hypothetical protein